MDDSSLQRLISGTPPNCILLLEDIDCAFASRDGEEDDDDASNGKPFDPISFGQPKSQVTLSGILNILDSVSSEEGRIVFATTNHIDRLDSALLRPGRMDVRVEYKNALKSQASDLFTRFYSQELMIKSFEVASKKDLSLSTSPLASGASTPSATSPTSPNNEEKKRIISPEAAALIRRADNSSYITSVPSREEIHTLAEEFASKIPDHRFSIAQLQGYLLCSKRDPRGAVTLLGEWLTERAEEEKAKEERLVKRRAERQKWMKVEKFRAGKEKKEQEEMEKQLAEEADKAEQEEKKAAEAAAAAEGEGDKKPEDTTETEKAGEETKVDEKAVPVPSVQVEAPQDEHPDGSSDKDSEPEMVETPSPRGEAAATA